MSTVASPLAPAPVPTVDSWRTLRRLVGRFRPFRARATAVFLLLLGRSGIEIAFPLVVARAVDGLVAHEGPGGALPPGYGALVGVLAGLIVLRAVGFYATGVQAARVSLDVETRLRGDLFRQVMHLRFRYHDANRSGATIVRSLRDMEKARHFFREVWFGYLEVGLLLAAVLVASLVTFWAYGVVIATVFGLGIAACVAVGRRVAQLDRGVSEDYDRMTSALQENVAGASVVRAFGREQQESSRFGRRMDALSGGWSRMERFWTGVMPAVNHGFHLAVPLLLLVGTWRAARGAGGIGEVTAVILYCRTVHHRIRPFTRLVILGQQAIASASRVFEVLDETDRIEAPPAPRRLPPHGGALRLEDVGFEHAGGTAVLRGVSLEVPAGGSLGIIGPTGSGKSTLVQLLPRFYDPTRGRILLDGNDLRDLDVDELREAVGLVFQEPFLFSASVRDNIAYGRPGLDAARVEACARLAAADGFVRELPDGYDTIVGERGVSLSGGQRQRLTIARALALDPRVLVFDDATASVDAITEKALFDGIRAAARERTTLVVSQRVTSVRWCDRIAVLDGGLLVDVGTHAELLARCALYREIHDHQRLTRALP
jgi:ATP-binding cassette subfamily B protein